MLSCCMVVLFPVTVCGGYVALCPSFSLIQPRPLAVLYAMPEKLHELKETREI